MKRLTTNDLQAFKMIYELPRHIYNEKLGDPIQMSHLRPRMQRACNRLAEAGMIVKGHDNSGRATFYFDEQLINQQHPFYAECVAYAKGE